MVSSAPKTSTSRDFKECLRILSERDKRKLGLICAVQSGLGLLDLIGVALIGVLGAISVSGLNSQGVGTQVSNLLQFLGLRNASFNQQIVFLSILSVVFFSVRTISSIILTRKILFYLSLKGAKVSEQLTSQLLSKPLLEIQKRSPQQTIYALTSGVESIVLQVIGTSIILISDVSLLILIIFGLFLVDPLTSIASLLIFGLVGLLLYLFMNVRARSLGVKSSELSVKGAEKISEVLATYRESVVRNRRAFFTQQISAIRYEMANVRAEVNFQPFISKYVIETTLIIGAMFIGGLQMLMQDSAQAVANLAIFLTAGTRIAPAVLRIQQSTIQIKAGIGQAKPSLELIDQIGLRETQIPESSEIDVDHHGFTPHISLKNVTFKYPGQVSNAVSNVNLEILPGKIVAIVGPSGSGKTTLVDLMLGVLSLQGGDVRISGERPNHASVIWPGSIGYVPQDTSIINGTIEENVGLGYSKESIKSNFELIQTALNLSQIASFVASLPLKSQTLIGDHGIQLSGGQRQRLGIARALLTKPKFLVLDEATSALDGETEALFSEAVSNLRGNTTVVIIAHRLSTVRNVDQVVYLDGGVIKSLGTFSEVRKDVPDFDKQAQIMGL
jgi:ABC-type multidrug transport system fused ATPase/permease subunit